MSGNVHRLFRRNTPQGRARTGRIVIGRDHDDLIPGAFDVTRQFLDTGALNPVVIRYQYAHWVPYRDVGRLLLRSIPRLNPDLWEE